MSDPSMHDASCELFVFLPDQVRAFIAENGVDLPDLLRREGIDVGARQTINPAAGGEGERDLILVLLGAAAVITALTPVLMKIVENIAGRPVIATETRLRPVETSAGKVVHDKDGNPILHWVDETREIEPRAAPEPGGSTRCRDRHERQ